MVTYHVFVQVNHMPFKDKNLSKEIKGETS